MAASALQPVFLRHGRAIEDPVRVVLGFLESGWQLDLGNLFRPASFDARDLKLANRYGARISAAEAAEILARRRSIDRALREVATEASLAASSVPWPALRRLFDAFADIRGVGCSKMTKALHPKRPALIPMLDSVVQQYLEDDDLGRKAPFGERTLELARGYKKDLDRNRAALRAARRVLARRGCLLSEVRILDLLIWSIQAAR